VQLLLVILHREELLDDVLSLLVELELPDAVVVESRSGLELLERDLPIFAGLRSLIPAGIDFCRLLLCLAEDPTAADHAVAGIRRLGEGIRHVEGEAANTVMLLPVTTAARF
jgi:hypothetical protein